MNAEPWVVALSLLLVGVPFGAVLIYGGLVVPVQEICEAFRDRRSRSRHARRAGQRDGRHGRPSSSYGDRPHGERGGASERVPCGAVSHRRAVSDEREGTE